MWVSCIVTSTIFPHKSLSHPTVSKLVMHFFSAVSCQNVLCENSMLEMCIQHNRGSFYIMTKKKKKESLITVRLFNTVWGLK